MKTVPLSAALAMVLSAAISFFIADYAAEDRMVMVGVGCFVSLCATAIPGLAMRFSSDRIAMVGKTSSMGFFVAVTVAQALYSGFSITSIPLYLLVTTGLLVAHLLVLSAVTRSGQ
jgi:hypothetical protein